MNNLIVLYGGNASRRCKENVGEWKRMVIIDMCIWYQKVYT